MIIVGIPDCEMCQIVSDKFPDYQYIKLNPVSKTTIERLIKKKLYEQNKDKKYPVMFSDDLKTMYSRDEVLTKLNLNMILQDGRTNKKSDIKV